MKDLVSCVHIVAKVFTWQTTSKNCIYLKSVPHVKHDYFSSFNQPDHCLLASWSLLKRPICQRLRVLSSTGNIALLCLRLTPQGGAKKEKIL